MATGVLEVATAVELMAALNDPGLHYIYIAEDLSLEEEIAFTRDSPLVVEGACGGGTRACKITPARNNPTFSDVWGYTCSDWRGYCREDSSIDLCPVPSVPEVGPDGSTCEVGGYVDASGYFYSKAHLDMIRSQCPLECADTEYEEATGPEIRLFGITLNMQLGEELSFVGLTFDGGMPTDGVGPVGTSGAIQRIQFLL